MRLLVSVSLALLAALPGVAQELPVFRIQLPAPLLIGGNTSDVGTNVPLVIEVDAPAPSRMPASITVPVDIAGMVDGDTIMVDAAGGGIWAQTGVGTGTISWSNPSPGSHIVTVSVHDAGNALRDSRQIVLKVAGPLEASVEENAYSADVGGTLTITPAVTGLLGEGVGAVRWGITPGNLTSWLDEMSGTVTVDTSTSLSIDGIRLTAVDQVDYLDAMTEEFSVAVQACGWKSVAAPEMNQWRSVAYGNGRFVAVASSGTNKVMTSTDGENWSLHQVPGDNQWQNIIFANGRFVAVATIGDTYRIMFSLDGENWERATVPLQANWDALAYGNGRYVAVSIGGYAMQSTNLSLWAMASQPPPSAWHSVTYGNGRFVAVAYGGANRVMTSTDGVSWTGVSVAANTWRSVTYGNGTFVAVANGGTNRVMTSSDGITWYPQSVPEEGWMSVTYANGQFIAVATAGGADRIMTSPNGIDWTTQTAPQEQWQSVAYGDGKYVAVATSGDNRIMLLDCP